MSKIIYDTMADAKLIFDAMKRKAKDEREDAKFFAHKKDKFSYWLHWYLGMDFDYIVTENIEEDGKEDNNSAGVDNNEVTEL